ncbi:SDR family NAD(P)-dependent oxidoreductase [Halovulum dunhuangense]|uniref:SDR family NAD(P)-dependent oxidoreductase n=1 Tax=Halovulum dunhuangense TaxID=1505036 RepID=A0A849L0W2_9RHOB|nr:SDR family NAD(P)-dependent oxidoreductase [Halovulum dunhuangense]NNU79907.1 SDR family NAD(P)-dependent oxidoreductase [Halovulum dunhuangense]
MKITPDPNLRILLIGASGGIGAAMADALQGTRLATLSRSADGLDVTDEASVAAAAARLEGPFDLIFDATGALEIGGHGPEKALAQIDPQAMAAQFALNAIGPALLLKHFGPHLRREGRAVFATLSARVGSIGDNRLGGWISYRAAKAALNQIVRTAAIELARRNRETIVVALHPGTVQTDLTRKYLGRHPAVTPEEAAQNLLKVLAGLTPAQNGGFFDYAGKDIPW